MKNPSRKRSNQRRSDPEAHVGKRPPARSRAAERDRAAQRARKKKKVQRIEERPAAARDRGDGAARSAPPAFANRLPIEQGRLDAFKERPEGQRLTTDQGIRIVHTDDSLRVGPRGPSLLEDFHLREKITRFDHERIPERVVHARGSGAHGHFQVYESLEDICCADFLCDPKARTPVFVRFSTVVGSRGSSDLARDVRGFATKFYTREGNFDLVGNNIPVFFIQDGIKFPDLVHAVKPEPHHEMPQAASAHDTFWDFVSLVPETLHMVMWVMSDRALPRSYRMMEGFGVHTFRLVNAQRRSVLVKFHWKPVLGAHSILWDEAQQISGKDPDFHRRDLWEAIESGNFPEYELGLQVMSEDDQLAFGFDLLDATKLVPEELVPVRRVGKLTLDRNPDNFFAETEQVAFGVGNVVPGIDFTDDPLLQARIFSYLDTQLLRLGGPNFVEIPINRPVARVHNHQQDGLHRTTIPTARALYHPNSIAANAPRLATDGFVHFEEPLRGAKVRTRSDSFADHFSQARMFLHSQSPPERQHLVDACRFELGKVERLAIRERVVGHFREIDEEFAAEVAEAIGVRLPAQPRASDRRGRGAKNESQLEASPALSLANSPKESIKTRKVAVLIANGVRADDVEQVCGALCREGATEECVSLVLGPIQSAEGRSLAAAKSFLTTASVLYDAVFIPGGAASVDQLGESKRAVGFVREAFAHKKPIGATNEGIALLLGALAETETELGARSAGLTDEFGVVTAEADELDEFAQAFIDAIRQHRHFDRRAVPARLQS
jgi:catalase